MQLVIQDVSKKFKDKAAVDQVSLELNKGVWGLLGANGAGKTTLMRMITGIIKPTSGQILYDGVGAIQLGEAYRNVIGYLPQTFGYYPEFKVEDYLKYMSALKGLSTKTALSRIDELLQSLNLTDVRKKRISKLSGGMQRRVGIAQALLNEPELLILDEPTSGLDPGERIKLRNILSEFARDRIVLISTHIVSDIEYIATKNAVMKDGKIAAVGTTDELVQIMDGRVWECIIPDIMLGKYEVQSRIVNVKNEAPGYLSVRYLSDNPNIPESHTVQARLEDLYLWLFPNDGIEHENGGTK